MHRYLVGSLSIEGHSFEYTGTGRELFIGFLKAFPVLIIFYGTFFYSLMIAESQPILGYSLAGVTVVLLFFLALAGFYWGMRYRISRITFMGIRGRLAGSAIKFVMVELYSLFLKLFTLGIASPYGDIKTII